MGRRRFVQGAARDGAARPHELRAGLIAGLIVFAVVFVAYGAGAELAWRVFAADIGLAFFPPAGVTVAALALLPRRRWWAVFAAIVAAEIAVDLEHGLSLGLAIGYAAANCVEPLVAVSVLRRLSPGRLDLGRRRGAVSFIVAAVGAGAGAGAVVGGLVKVAQSAVPWWDAALHWWAGDGLGILAIGVAIIACREVRLPAGRRLLEPVLCLAAVLAASIVAFWVSSTPPAFLLLPVLVWAALRLGPRGVSVCSAVMAIVANAATARGRGPFAVLDVSAQAQLGYAQLFLGSVIITVWFLAIETTERAEASAERELERAAKERAESAAATGALSAALVRQASIDDIAALVDGHLRRHFDTALAVIVLYDSSTGAFWAPASLPAPARDASAGWTLDTPAPGPAALAGGEAVWVGSRRELLERFPAMGAVATPLELGALGALPMQLEGRPLGYLGVARNVDRPFTPTERGELAVISGIVAQALDRTELYEAERRSRLDAQAAYGEVQKLLRRAAYEANLLRESEQRFQLLADQSPLLIWVHDAAGEQQWVNQTFCDFFGIDRADAAHGRWPDLLHPDDAAGYLAELADALERRRPFHAEARVRGTNGDWRWIESWGQPRFGPEGEFAGHVGGSADVTDRRLAEQELAAAHQFVQEVTALAPGVIAVLDLDLGRNVFVSRRSFEVLRDEPDEPIALGEASLPSVLHPDDQERVKANLAAARALGDGETMAVDYRLRRRDGSWRWFRSTATPLRRDLGGVVSQVATLTIDITDQKAHEAQVQAAAALDAFRARLADALVGVTDLAEIQGRAARLLVDQLGAAGACFVEPHEPAARRTAPIGWPPPPPEDGPRYETLARAAQGGGPRVIDNDAAADARLALDALGNGACVVQALPAGHRPCTLVVRRGQPHLWAESELALVAETAERTGAALRRAQTERDQQRRRTQAELLARVLAELEDQPDPAAAMQHLAEALVPELADSATVVQSAPRRDVLGFAHRGGARPSADSAPHSHAAAALDLGDGARASLFVGLSDPARDPFTGEDRAFLADLAQRVGVVVAAAQVRRAEHDIAVTLQNALLPDRVCWDAAVAVEARYQAASGVMQVGGDWYDTFAWPDGRIGIMVGDVVGHNLESAAAMGRMRAAAAALAGAGEPSPAALLDALDRFARGPNGVSFATAACVVVDPATGRLTYSCAGHPPPLVLGAEGEVRRLEGAQSRPLGAFTAGARPEAALTLQPGSLVVLYSDGLIERRRQHLDTGLAALEAALVERRHTATGALIDEVIAALTVDSPAQDDIVVAAFRYTPARAALRLSVPARSDELAGLRRRLRGWLEERGIGADAQDAVLVAISEAATNVIDHAYRRAPAPGAIELALTDHGHHVVARVRDHGAWRAPGNHSRDRGRGALIMRALADHYELQSGPEGTTVTLAVARPAPLPALSA